MYNHLLCTEHLLQQGTHKLFLYMCPVQIQGFAITKKWLIIYKELNIHNS